jgi:hypothetical protein
VDMMESNIFNHCPNRTKFWTFDICPLYNITTSLWTHKRM